MCTGDKKPGRQLTGWVAAAMMESIHCLPRQEAMGTPCARIAYLEQCPCGHLARRAAVGQSRAGVQSAWAPPDPRQEAPTQMRRASKQA